MVSVSPADAAHVADPDRSDTEIKCYVCGPIKQNEVLTEALSYSLLTGPHALLC